MVKITSYNPSLNYEEIWQVSVTTEEELRIILQNARKAFMSWKGVGIESRVTVLRQLYDAFDIKREDIARSISREMGMPIRQARDEVQYGMNYFSWYLENAKQCLSPEVTFENDAEIHAVHYEPKGIVAAIAPWNYPFSMFVWTSIQALLAGNVVIFKTSKDVILTGKLIADIADSCNIPKWVLSQIFGDGTLWNMLAESEIDFITFTWSTKVGKWLAQIATRNGIGCVMELWGSAPGIVCADADLEKVLDTIFFLRFSNSGQMCDGLKRLIVHKSRYDDVVAGLKRRMLQKVIGNALEETTDIGPLVSGKQLEQLQIQYRDALEKWATILTQATLSDSIHGAYFAPTILGWITPDMLVWREEVFGPILPIVPFTTLREAIELANDTKYGLWAYVFTEDEEGFDDIAREMESGMVQLNNVNYCIPASPFGGYKESGIGREHGKWGFHEFSNIKTISKPKV